MELEGTKRKVPNVLITGTPGVGKTTLAKLLGEYIEGFKVFNVGEWINSQKLYKTWNPEFDVPEYDEDLVVDFFEPIINQEGCILDFHSSDFFPQRWFDLIVLLRTNNTALYDRLKQRNYTEKKITENLDCEIMEVTHDEVYEAYPENAILELKNDLPEDVEKNIAVIIEWLKKWKENK